MPCMILLPYCHVNIDFIKGTKESKLRGGGEGRVRTQNNSTNCEFFLKILDILNSYFQIFTTLYHLVR